MADLTDADSSNIPQSNSVDSSVKLSKPDSPLSLILNKSGISCINVFNGLKCNTPFSSFLRLEIVKNHIDRAKVEFSNKQIDLDSAKLSVVNEHFDIVKKILFSGQDIFVVIDRIINIYNSPIIINLIYEIIINECFQNIRCNYSSETRRITIDGVSDVNNPNNNFKMGFVCDIPNEIELISFCDKVGSASAYKANTDIKTEFNESIHIYFKSCPMLLHEQIGVEQIFLIALKSNKYSLEYLHSRLDNILARSEEEVGS